MTLYNKPRISPYGAAKKPAPRPPYSAPTPAVSVTPEAVTTAASTTATSTAKEIKYYGMAACLALWQQRPADIIRVYVQTAHLKETSHLLQWAANQHLAYHIVEADDLVALTESIHHQGICILARERASTPVAEVKTAVQTATQSQLLVYLDGVENPHNFGAIIRSCAHFGLVYVLGDAAQLPKLSPSACRVAEGGAEFVKLVRLSDPLATLAELTALGCKIIATDLRGKSVYQHRYQPIPNQHTVLIMGAEAQGVSPALLKLTHRSLTIPGSNQIDSLNVAAAFAIFASEFNRQTRFAETLAPKPPKRADYRRSAVQKK